MRDALVETAPEGGDREGEDAMAKRSAFLMGAALLVAGMVTGASAPAKPAGWPAVGATSIASESPTSNGLVVKIIKARVNLKQRLAVAWTATQEQSVASYEVWGSASPRSALHQLSLGIAPLDGYYNVKFPSQGAGYIRICAIMDDGSVVASDTVKVTK
jgi:hypothetical protein